MKHPKTTRRVDHYLHQRMMIRRVLVGLFAAVVGVAAQNDVHVGILHSQTGTLAISELSVIQAELLAISEINAAGGVLGRRIVPVIRDGASDGPTFAREAQALVSNSSIVNVFGCWTSASRKAVKPVFEASKIMLWYPVQYEGQECSPLEPAVRWLLNTYPNYPFFLLGSDYVFPRTANAIIKAMLNTLGRPNVAESYCVLPRNEADRTANALVLDKVIEDMKRLMPNGGIVFQYVEWGCERCETEVAEIGVSKLIGHFASWNYFMTDPTQEPLTDADFLSRTFILNFWKKYNDTSLLLNDPMEAAYINVYMWALAVEKAQTFAAEKVRLAAYNMRFDAPEGTVILRSNHHLAKYPWNQYIDETRGRIYLRSPIGQREFFKPPSIEAVLLYRPSVSNVLDSQNLAIDMLNTNENGINGRRIVSTIINLDWRKARLIALL
ncbi:periplasmic binding protein domain-containing protein [Chytridium lagenaria]|nr:periplasmic binding protein domain-containing protein [Chytridium lagenaria]